MDEVGKKSDAPGKGVDDRLRRRRSAENREANRNSTDPCSRANDRAINEAMRMSVSVVVRVFRSDERQRTAWKADGKQQWRAPAKRLTRKRGKEPI